MLLQTMTEREKIEALKPFREKMIEYSYKWMQNKKNRKAFFKCRKYPYCFSEKMDLTYCGLGKWTLLLMCEKKEYQKRGILTMFAYQKFTTEHTDKETNAGTGIYLYRGSDDGSYGLDEYSPHYFNRIRERCDFYTFGKQQPNFDTLIKRVICDQQVEDVWNKNAFKTTSINVTEDMFADFKIEKIEDTDRRKGFKNLSVYQKHGISLGLESINTPYRLFLTYVPNDSLRKEQIIRKDSIRNNKFKSVIFFEDKVIPIKEHKYDIKEDIQKILKQQNALMEHQI